MLGLLWDNCCEPFEGRKRWRALEPMQVIMVDDDAEYCDMVAAYLRDDGFSVKAVYRGDHALSIVESRDFDAMILDLMMPGMTGHEVMRRLQVRESTLTPVPVLMLTARGDDLDRIVGLECGADDYLAKPCNLRELAARLRAIVRRSKPPGGRPSAPVIAVAGVQLDPSTLQAWQDSVPLKVTGTEFAVLRALMESPGRPVSKEILTTVALGREFEPYDRSIDVHVASLRKKLRPVEGLGTLIKTVRGAGYQFAAPKER